MNAETHTAPPKPKQDRQTAALRAQLQQQRLEKLFHKGWDHLINRQWRLAEEAFAQIEAHNSHFEQDGIRASYLRQKACYEREAEAALKAGNLEEALIAYKKADDFEHVKELHQLLTIQELEAKAEKFARSANYQEAAWIYDHLLNEFPNNEKETFWQIKMASCWEAELSPFFNTGVEALEAQKWREAYNAFAQVLIVDPYFRYRGRSAAELAEIARQKVVTWGDEALRRGEIKNALDAYREVGHFSRIDSVEEFLRLRKREEVSAHRLEAAGKWQAAAAKYRYLSTLYYKENQRQKWREAETRCLEEGRLGRLYGQGITAFNSKRWSEAKRIFAEIIRIRPDYQPGEEPARKLYRTAWWRSLFDWFNTHSNSHPPQIQT